MKKRILLLIMILFSFSFSSELEKFNIKLEKNETFSNVLLTKLDGKEELSNNIFNKDKKSLIVVAAEWCPACVQQMGELEKFYGQNSSKYNIITIFISQRSSITKVKDYISSNNYVFPVYYDYDNTILMGAKVRSVPTSIFLDKNKKIIDVQERILTVQEYESILN